MPVIRTLSGVKEYVLIVVVVKWVYLLIRIRTEYAIYCISDIKFEFYAFELPNIKAFYR